MLKIIDLLDLTLEEVKNNVVWIGALSGNGIPNPKLPFYFSTRAAARFLAAICNEGWISDGLYYSNSKKELRDSVRRDALSIFGGDKNTVKEWVKVKDQYLSFTSIIRDVVQLITGFKGVKSVNNPPVPPFVLEDEELIYGWIEQTIADEGHVKHYPKTYRREIIWRRSFNKNLDEYKLNRDERKMLDKIGIDYDLKNIGTYKTKKGIEKTKLQMRIAKRENLLTLRKLIKIPDRKKDDIFTEMMKGFVRYKELLRIRDIIIKICKEKDYVTSTRLKEEMNYKEVNTAVKWINFYFNNGLLKCIQGFYYGDSVGRLPAKYILNEP